MFTVFLCLKETHAVLLCVPCSCGAGTVTGGENPSRAGRARLFGERSRPVGNYGQPSFQCASQTLHFLQSEGLWGPCIQQVRWGHFSSSVCSFHVSVSHFGNSRNTSICFILIFVVVVCDHDL